jgi:hypothetical protein
LKKNAVFLYFSLRLWIVREVRGKTDNQFNITTNHPNSTNGFIAQGGIFNREGE